MYSRELRKFKGLLRQVKRPLQQTATRPLSTTLSKPQPIPKSTSTIYRPHSYSSKQIVKQFEQHLQSQHDSVSSKLEFIASELDKEKNYERRLELILKNLGELENAAIQNKYEDLATQARHLKTQFQKELKENFYENVIYWTKKYKNKTPDMMISEMEKIADHPAEKNSLLELDQKVRMRALQLCFPRPISVACIATSGVIATDLAEIAASLHLRTHLICPEVHKHSLAAQKVEAVSHVKNLNDPHQYIEQIEARQNQSPQFYRIRDEEGEKFIVVKPGENPPAGAVPAGGKVVMPGVGGISENPEAPKLCAERGLIFGGPSHGPMTKSANKDEACDMAESLGLPILKSYRGKAQDIDTFIREWKRIGEESVFKGIGGGGGNQNRFITNEMELRSARASIPGRAILEQRIPKNAAYQVEFQAFRDASGAVVILPVIRITSLQDKFGQKQFHIGMPIAVARKYYENMDNMLAGSTRLMEAATDYVGANTVEWLGNRATKKSYFMEMNTRLQVEYPTTEAATAFYVDHDPQLSNLFPRCDGAIPQKKIPAFSVLFSIPQLMYYLFGSGVARIQGKLVHIPGEPTLANFFAAHLQAYGLSLKGLSSPQEMVNRLYQSSPSFLVVEARLNVARPTIHQGKVFSTSVEGTAGDLHIPEPTKNEIIRSAITKGSMVDSFKTNSTTQLVLVREKIDEGEEELANTKAWRALGNLLSKVHIDLPTNQLYLLDAISVMEKKPIGSWFTGTCETEVDPVYIDNEALRPLLGVDEENTARHSASIALSTHSWFGENNNREYSPAFGTCEQSRPAMR